jgi:heme-degrading monooxygenase HmoA
VFIAMNRFQVVPGREEAFEQVWRERESYLDEVGGFKEFHLLRGPGSDDATLYVSHTIWESREAFEAWTKSDSFRKSHARAGSGGPSNTVGHPAFEGFEQVL